MHAVVRWMALHANFVPRRGMSSNAFNAGSRVSAANADIRSDTTWQKALVKEKRAQLRFHDSSHCTTGHA